MLAEVGGSGHNVLVSVHANGAEAAADWNDLKSGENYVGYGRTENFSSSGGARPDKRHEYSVPKSLDLNCWALSGIWTMGREAIALNQANGRIVYRFHARDFHLVMGPVAPGTFPRFRVLMDGGPPGNAHGVDVDERGNGTVTEPRMYQLIRQPAPIVDRQFEIAIVDEPPSKNMGIYVKIRPSNLAFDCDFPNAHSAEKQFVIVVENQRASLLREFRRLSRRP